MFKQKFVLVSAVLSLCAAPALAADRISMASPWPGGQGIEAMERIAKTVKDLSSGKVDLEVLPGGAIGSALKVTEAVKKGLAGAGHNWAGYDWSIDTTSMLFSGYAGSPSADIMLHWITQGGGSKLWGEWRKEKFGVVAIPCGVAPAEVGMISTKRIQKLSDFKGVKMRTSGAWAEIGAGLGMSTVSMAGSEIYPALERGVIDALEWGSLSTNLRQGFHQIAKFNIFPALHQPVATFECLFNKKVWAKLGPHNQKIIEIASALELRYGYESRGDEDAQAYKKYQEAKVEFVVLDDEVIQKAKELTAAWSNKHAAKNEWFKRVLEHQRAYAKKWEAAHIYR